MSKTMALALRQLGLRKMRDRVWINFTVNKNIRKIKSQLSSSGNKKLLTDCINLSLSVIYLSLCCVLVVVRSRNNYISMSRLVYDYNLFPYLHNCVASVASINGKIIPLC